MSWNPFSILSCHFRLRVSSGPSLFNRSGDLRVPDEVAECNQAYQICMPHIDGELSCLKEGL